MCANVNHNTQPQNPGQIWMLLVGINRYKDITLPDLNYAAFDCQGLSDAFKEVPNKFEHQDKFVHHDSARKLPTSREVRVSLNQIKTKAKPQDTILFYFSGHGVLEPTTQEAVLCFQDTVCTNLLETGLPLSELLRQLKESAPKVQFAWLDACHSGNLNAHEPSSISSPTPQLIQGLQQQAAQMPRFYALLSCDKDQLSWEFPEFGHGIFTYYLIRGLRGEAVDQQGYIKADELYRYLYTQTQHYIEEKNRQIRLINQQIRERGESEIYPEYSLQQPKRIVEGVGNFVLGSGIPQTQRYKWKYNCRQAVVIEGQNFNPTNLELSKVLSHHGHFQVDHWQPSEINLTKIKQAIRNCFQSCQSDQNWYHEADETALLYLQGHIEINAAGYTWLVLANHVYLPLTWLRQQVQQATVARHIIVLDCPGAGKELVAWIDDLKLEQNYSQCLVTASAPSDQPERFAQVVLETVKNNSLQDGLSVANWFYQLKAKLAETTIQPYFWLSGSKGVIQFVPRKSYLQDPPLPPLPCPYKGLRAFEESDHRFFFGREKLTQTLLNNLYNRSFLALVGASGSGKSSVIHAGLLVQLRQGQQIPGSDSWRICKFRPGENPLEQLAYHLTNPEVNLEPQKQKATRDPSQLKELLEQEDITEFVCWLDKCPESKVLLIIDQFEEVFTLTSSTNRQQFLNLLLGAIDEAGEHFKVVISLRADFVTPCLNFPKLASWLQEASIFVSPYLTEDEYHQIIVKPAELVGWEVQPELVNVLLRELSTACGSLPLLEFVLEQLWQYRDHDERKLTLEAYHQKIGGLEGALERKANLVYNSLDEEAQACVQRIFLYLTHLGESIDTSRRVSKAKLVDNNKYPERLIEDTLQVLTDATLVVVDRAESQKGLNNTNTNASSEVAVETVEVAHEILIRNWSKLQQWLTENRQDLQLQRELQQAAKLWQENNRNPDYLWQGEQLAEAEHIYNNYFNELSQQVQQFIRTGREQQERLERLKTIRKRVFQILIGLCLGLGAGFSVFFWINQEMARARRLATYAKRLAPKEVPTEPSSFKDHDLSALLAVKAYQIANQAEISFFGISFFDPNPPVEINQALRSSLETIPYKNLMHSSPVRGVAYGPNGEQVITGSSDGTVRIWNLKTEQVIVSFEHRASVETVIYGPNGERVITGSSDGTARVWNLETEKEIARFDHHGKPVNAVAFGPEGKRLLTGNGDGTARVWNLETEKEIARFDHHGQPVNAVAFGPEGKRLLTGSIDGTARVWNLETEKEIARFDHQGSVNAVNYGPEGEQILTGSSDNKARIWNLETQEEIAHFSHEEPIKDVTYALEGKRVVTSSKDGTVGVWNVNTEKKIDYLNHSQSVNAVAYHSGKNEVLTGSNNGIARIKKVQKGAEINQFKHNYAIRNLAYSPNGKIALTSSSTFNNENVGGIVKVWRTQNGKQIGSLAYSSLVTSMSYGPEGNYILTGHKDGVARIRNLNNDNKVKLGNNKRINAVAYGPQGEQFLTAHRDGITRIWNVDTKKIIARLGKENNHSSVEALAYGPKGDRLLTGHKDGTARIWNLNTEQVITSFDQSNSVTTVAYGPQGNTVMVGDQSGNVNIWSPDSEKQRTTLFMVGNQDDSKEPIANFNHDNAVRDVVYGSRGNKVITGSSDTTVRAWEIATEEEIAKITFYNNPIKALAYEPTANKILAGTNNGVANSHWIHSNKLKEQLCQKMGRNFKSKEWEKYMNSSLEEYEIVCPQLSVHPKVIEKAIRLAKQGQKDKAINILRHIKQLEGSIDLNPETEKTETNPKVAVKNAIEANPPENQQTHSSDNSSDSNLPQEQESVRTLKDVYRANERIQVQFNNLPGNKTDWITIRPAEAPDNSYDELRWEYTYGREKGTMTFEPLPTGEYEVRLYFDWKNTGSYQVRDRYFFRVTESGD